MRAAGGQNTKWLIHLCGNRKTNVADQQKDAMYGFIQVTQTYLSIKKASYIFMMALASTNEKQHGAASKAAGINKWMKALLENYRHILILQFKPAILRNKVQKKEGKCKERADWKPQFFQLLKILN